VIDSTSAVIADVYGTPFDFSLSPTSSIDPAIVLLPIEANSTIIGDGFELAKGKNLYVTVTATNGAGLTCSAVSPRVVVDYTAPDPFTIRFSSLVAQGAAGSVVMETSPVPGSNAIAMKLITQRIVEPESTILRYDVIVTRKQPRVQHADNVTQSLADQLGGVFVSLPASAIPISRPDEVEISVVVPANKAIDGTWYAVVGIQTAHGFSQISTLKSAAILDRTPPSVANCKPRIVPIGTYAPLPENLIIPSGILQGIPSSASSIRVTWNAAVDEESIVDHYIVQVRDGVSKLNWFSINGVSTSGNTFEAIFGTSSFGAG
jgi:hypothetical protein